MKRSWQIWSLVSNFISLWKHLHCEVLGINKHMFSSMNFPGPWGQLKYWNGITHFCSALTTLGKTLRDHERGYFLKICFNFWGIFCVFKLFGNIILHVEKCTYSKHMINSMSFDMQSPS